MSKISILAPAKLNLFLHITGRRDNGYHELQTVFQLLNYGDQLTFLARDDDKITITPEIPGISFEDNLITKAASLIKKRSTNSCGVDIILEKKLPMGGGIGGGSSDAAATLVALNKLWCVGLSPKELATLGLQLGADVPVFVQGKTAWAEGVGEDLQPLELKPLWYCVLAPNCHVSTTDIFSQKDLTRDTSPITIPAFLDQGGRNDCQSIVEQLYPPVKNALEWLNQYSPAQMTGTGACVFASFSSQAEAESVFSNRPSELGGFIAQGINKSPLTELL